MSVHKSQLEADLIQKVEPVVEDLGLKLRDIDIHGVAGSSVVRVIIDRDDSPIGIEDCSRAHQVLNPLFDVWDPIPGAYTLELSSPGEKPNLRLIDHFVKAKGESIRFETIEAFPMPAPAKPRKKWDSLLEDVDTAKGTITVKDSYGTHTVPLDQIKHAKWLRNWETKK